MDVPSELIREQVNEEAKFEDSLHAFDPLIGDLLALSHVFDGSKRSCGFIAFPMGESGCDLSEDISHLLAGVRDQRPHRCFQFGVLCKWKDYHRALSLFGKEI